MAPKGLSSVLVCDPQHVEHVGVPQHGLNQEKPQPFFRWWHLFVSNFDRAQVALQLHTRDAEVTWPIPEPRGRLELPTAPARGLQSAPKKGAFSLTGAPKSSVMQMPCVAFPLSPWTKDHLIPSTLWQICMGKGGSLGERAPVCPASSPGS